MPQPTVATASQMKSSSLPILCGMHYSCVSPRTSCANKISIATRVGKLLHGSVASRQLTNVSRLPGKVLRSLRMRHRPRLYLYRIIFACLSCLPDTRRRYATMKTGMTLESHQEGSRMWLSLVTGILSIPGMAVGLASTAYHFWYWAPGTNRNSGGGTIGRSIQLILLLNL